MFSVDWTTKMANNFSALKITCSLQTEPVLAIRKLNRFICGTRFLNIDRCITM